MPLGYTLMLLLGFGLFGLGGVARTYMNNRISQSTLGDTPWWTRTTEVTYRRLLKEQHERNVWVLSINAREAPLWPLVVALVCMPLGILLVVAAIILSPATP